jgi:hypothetical protein
MSQPSPDHSRPNLSSHHFEGQKAPYPGTAITPSSERSFDTLRAPGSTNLQTDRELSINPFAPPKEIAERTPTGEKEKAEVPIVLEAADHASKCLFVATCAVTASLGALTLFTHASTGSVPELYENSLLGSFFASQSTLLLWMTCRFATYFWKDQ